jgi:predicted transcriptional regulator of viral defense system
MRGTARERLLGLATKRPILRAADAARLGLHTQALTRLVAEGALERVGRGRYRSPSADVTEHHGLALTAAAVPRGVVCLLSALVFTASALRIPRKSG